MARLAIGNTLTGVVMRMMLPAAIGIPVVLGWAVTELQRAEVVPSSLSLAYYTLAIILVFSLLTILAALLLDRSDSHRRQAEQEVRTLNADLQRRVIERTAALEALNKDLEAFSYSVSHDLRAPLRHVAGFATLLNERAGPALDDEGRQHLQRITAAARRMGQLIDDLLAFSRLGRSALNTGSVNLNTLVLEARREVSAQPGIARDIHWHVDNLPDVDADPAMLRLAIVNLLSNAVKYSSPRDVARIDIGTTNGTPGPSHEVVVFIRDNGVGFDMRYADKLFGVFQRLHRVDEFEGTGVGLANVKRIITRHGGRVWAESVVDRGATFYLSLPAARTANNQDASKNPAP